MSPPDPAPDVGEVIAALAAIDPAVLERDELVAITGEIAAVKAWCDALQVRVTRRQRELAAAGRSESPIESMARHGRQSSREARAAEARERVCSTMSGVEDALASGAVSAGHVDAMASASFNLDEGQQAEFAAAADELLAHADQQSVDAFSRTCRDKAREIAAADSESSDADELEAQRKRANVKHWQDRETGMWHTHLELDPLRDRAVWTAIRHSLGKVRRRDGNRNTPWHTIEADAVVDAVSGGGEANRVPEVTVVVDERTRCHGRHEGSICETSDGEPLPVSTVQRLCCEAEIAIAHVGADGEVLDLGRSVRIANRAQRRALRAMYRTCAHPGCTVGFDHCRIHHVRYWRLGGRTDLINLLPLCEEHHHLVHEGGWVLTLDPDRVATWTRPDGVLHHRGPTIDRRPDDRSSAEGLSREPALV